jgi:uncharacterized protein YbbC (DUF1343 family)
MRTGLEVLVESDFASLRGKRVGLICNPTSVDRRFRHLADLMRASGKVNLRALFGPEHGVRGEAQDMVSVAGARDERTGVPVYSLYGQNHASLAPDPDWLQDLDVLVFDIQDVGSRYYTYVYTMALAMRAAASAKAKFVVLDRPNPITGVHVEGNLIKPSYRSFVGMYRLPNRHGMTAGELAGLFREMDGIDCELEIVRCEGWQRQAWFEDTGLPWVYPSPNMPTVDTALVYPGMCMVEGTNLSEGRGTTHPFEVFGAPQLDPHKVVDLLSKDDLPGVTFRPMHFTPMFQKHAGASCGGAMIHVDDREAFRPVRTGIAVLRACRLAGGEAFAWRTQPYEFVSDRLAIDLLSGGPDVRLAIDAGKSLTECMAGFEADLAEFLPLRERHLLY